MSEWNRPVDMKNDLSSMPLSGYPVFNTQSLDEAEERVSQIFCPHRLSRLSNGKQAKVVMNHAPLGDISLNYLQYGAPVEITPETLNDFFLVKFLIKGHIELDVDQKSRLVTAGHASIISPEQQARMKWSKNSQNLIVKINKDALESSLSNILGAHLPIPLRFHAGQSPQKSGDKGWLRSLIYMQNELEVSQGRNVPEPLQKNFAELCKLSLIYNHPHNYSEFLTTGLTRVAPHYVKRAEEYIAENLKNGVTIEELVDVSGVSARSLFAGFKEYRGTSPMKFIHNLRLERVHEDLQNNDKNFTITQIAFKWGFSQMGRFSGEYKKKFGQSPSRTLRRH